MLLAGLRTGPTDSKGRERSPAVIPSRLREADQDSSPSPSSDLVRPETTSGITRLPAPTSAAYGPMSAGPNMADSPFPNSPSLSSQQKRFSMLRFRHASDPHLSTRFKNASASGSATPQPALAVCEFFPHVKKGDSFEAVADQCQHNLLHSPPRLPLLMPPLPPWAFHPSQRRSGDQICSSLDLARSSLATKTLAQLETLLPAAILQRTSALKTLDVFQPLVLAALLQLVVM